MENNLEKIEKFVLYITIFLVVVGVIPLFPNPYVTPKIIVLVAGVSLILFIKALKTFIRGSVQMSVGTFDFPVLLLAAAYLVSGILNTPNKMEAFFLPGSATIILASTLLYLLINQFNDKDKKLLPLTIYFSGIVLALISLLSSSGVISNFAGLPAFVRDTNFSPLGGSLATLTFIIVAVPFGINYLLKESDVAKKAFWGIALALTLFGATTSLFNILPGKPGSPQLPSFNSSWFVAIDSLKVSPLLGVGPGNYLTAFNRFRPITYNQTDLWRVRFTSARDFYLTAITETGLVGLAAITILLYSLIKLFKKDDKEKKLVGWSTKNNTYFASLALLAILLALFPANPVFIMIFFALLALNAEISKINLGALSSHATHEKNDLSSQFARKLPVIVATLPVFIGLVALSFYGARFVSAEYKYKKAIDAVVANDGKTAYDDLRAAIAINPYVDRYHISYAQVNLALANVISQKKDLTDQDRSTITQLIQQAIREGKATVVLNPQRASNWEVLARIYQTVMPLAQDADTFAIQTFTQAVALDPINPELRVALGGIYYAQKDYDSAVRVFELATATKADYANAHFNLSYSLKEKGEIDRAIQEMGLVISLVDRNSSDYETAKKALEDLESKKKTAQKEGSENLTPPQEVKPAIEPQIELPEEAEPPTPKPEPTSTPEATLSPKSTSTPLP